MSKRRRPWRYWGYGVLLLVLGGWITGDVGPVVLLLLSGLSFLYFLFQAPVWCNARTRGGKYCRNNSYGLLVGCHIREHKWQSVMMLFSVSRWRELRGKLFRGFAAQAAVISAVGTLVSTIVAVIALLVKLPWISGKNSG